MSETLIGIIKLIVLTWTAVFTAVSVGSGATSWIKGVLRPKEIILIALFASPSILIPVTGGFAWATAILSLWPIMLGYMPNPPVLTPVDRDSPDVQPNHLAKSATAITFAIYFALQARGIVIAPGYYLWAKIW